MITAGGGASLYPRAERRFAEEVKYALEHHYVLATVSRGNCLFAVYNLDDELIESFTIQSRN